MWAYKSPGWRDGKEAALKFHRVGGVVEGERKSTAL